ncbi:MAG: ECF transporter S component [Oscillospiraceae bacterium]|nr:ECF transporter S component [Oscillospiraceae bacterium]
MKQKKRIGARIIAVVGVLTAVAVVLQYLEISIPLVPSFLKLDFSDLPALLGAYAFGPLAGVLIQLLKNLIHLAVSQSGFVGELSNFLLGAVFVLVAGLIYQRKKTKMRALIAGLVGAAAMALVSVPVNYFIVYPLYYSVLGFPEQAVLDMYQAILPSVGSIFESLLIFNLPFTLVKGLISVFISMLIYKPLSRLFKGE